MTERAQPHKYVSSKVLLDHPHIQITEDSIELPDGLRTTYVRRAAGQQPAVIMIAINSDGLMLVQQEYSYPPDQVMWQLPGGAVNNNEEILDAAQRELAEESGFQSHEAKIIGSFYTNNRFSDQQQHIVLCTDLYSHKLAEDYDEFIETHWLTPDDITTKITDGSFSNINLLAALNVWFNLNKKVKK